MSLARHACAAVLLTFACATVVRAGEIRGRAVVDGRPAGGVTVSVLPFEDGHAVSLREARREDLPKPLATAVTRPDGSFAAAVTTPPGSVVRLGFSGAGTTPIVLQRLVEAAGEDVGEILLTKAAVLAGRVTDERGGPVVGAAVTLWAGSGGGLALRRLDPGSAASSVPQTATTGADGTFRFELASAEGNSLRAEAPGLATAGRYGLRAGAVPKPLTLALGQVLRGTVTLGDRRTPAAGTLVRFEARSVTTRWVEARSDGSFVIEAAPREPGTLVADAGERGRGSLMLAGASAEPALVVLAPTASLGGRIVDADARPIAGVRLALREESGGSTALARSATNGAYSLRGLAPGRYRLTVSDDRFVAWSQWVTLAAGQAQARDVPLSPAAALSGRVVADDGRPIAGALVQVAAGSENTMLAFMRSFEAEGARSAADGSFMLKRLRPGDNQRLEVRHEDFEARTIGGLALAPGLRAGYTVVLRRGLSLQGFVKDEEGRPLPDVEVTLLRPLSITSGRGNMRMSMMGPGTQVQRQTGADGRFEFRGLKAGDYTLAARRSGFTRAALDPVKVGEGRDEPVQLVLKPGATVTGFVRDRSGNGSPGWTVSASQGGGSGMRFGPGAAGTDQPTGPDGAFVIEGLTAGESYDLQTIGGSGLGPRRGGVVAPADGVELVTSGSGQIRGRVVDADSGRALPDFQLRYQPDSQGGGMRVVMRAGGGPGGRGPYVKVPFHAEDGSFTLDEVPAGRWMLEAFAPGYQSGSAANLVVNEGDTLEGVDVRLAKGSTVSGRVVDARSGRAVLDAKVVAEPSGGMPRMGVVRIGNESGDNEAATDAEGRFEILGLAPGKWRLTASHADYSEASETVEVKDAATNAEIRLGKGGSVTGSVVGAGARPVAGAQVSLSPAGASQMGMMRGDKTAVTDEAGRFRFDRLEPGRLTLAATLRDETSAPVEAVLVGDETKDVQLTLGAGALIRGTVSGLPENRLSGISVSANGPDYFASTRTAANGSFELSGAPEGTISLHASAGDFLSSSRSASSSVTIAAGQAEVTAEIVFQPGIRVDGRVSRGGRPVTDAMVMAFPDGAGNRRTASGHTDESGSYVLEGLDEGAYEIQASSQSSMPIRRKVTLSGDTSVDLEAAPARLAGTVVDAEGGRPLAEVEVRVEDKGANASFMSAVTTDSAGRFSMDDVEPVPYRVAFQRAGYQAEVRTLTASEDSDVQVQMRRGDGIAVEARDGIFATPLHGLFVRVLDATGGAVFAGNVSLDSDGRGEVPALKPGSYEVRAQSQGYASVRLRGVQVPSRTLSLVLTPGGTLDIQCGPQTQALPEPTARLIGADGQPFPWNAFNEDGKIRLGSAFRRLENIPPGRYTVQMEGSATSREVTVNEGGTAVVSLP